MGFEVADFEVLGGLKWAGKVQKGGFQETNDLGKHSKTERLMESSKESLKILMETHFPDRSECTTTGQEWKAVTTLQTKWELVERIVSKNKVACSVGSFVLHKWADLEGMILDMLQNASEHIKETLIGILRKCLSLEYVPSSWQEIRVVFNSKTWKPRQRIVDESVLSFLLKNP